jgi:transposase-like protein
MDERLRFVARLLDGEKMAALCREFDVSRKTGYKIFQRYKDYGLDGLTDRSRRPYRHANQLPLPIEKLIVPRRGIGMRIKHKGTKKRATKDPHRHARHPQAPRATDDLIELWVYTADDNVAERMPSLKMPTPKPIS